ncbi:MAG: DNA polymerase III subunit delta' [Paracoccaceae bacterium]
MNDDAPVPEYDRVVGAPHPRETQQLYGQAVAEAAFLTALNTGRLHHGWLITGPRGIGKATLAWRIAKLLLTTPPPGSDGLFAENPPPVQSLDIPPDHPVNRRVAALSEPALFLLRPIWDIEKKRFKNGITVDEVRKMKGFFNHSAADGGRRVVIVDSVDDMNTNAANALLKILEEPPVNATLLLVSHQPSRLLPTIRSRCRELRCAVLPTEDMANAMTAAGADSGSNTGALTELSGGSAGEAVRLRNLGGMQTYADIINLFSDLPNMNRPKALKLAESAVGKTKSDQFDLILRLMDIFLARTARTGVSGPALVEASPGESTLMQRLAPDANAGRIWAELQQTLSERARHGQAVNLDPAALILDMFFKINETAAKTAAR